MVDMNAKVQFSTGVHSGTGIQCWNFRISQEEEEEKKVTPKTAIRARGQKVIYIQTKASSINLRTRFG